MPPRRSHKKSRAGCRRCKSRKIKCDEARPRCYNCEKHGVACDFEFPEIAAEFVIAQTPRPTAQASTPGATPSASSDVCTTPSIPTIQVHAATAAASPYASPRELPLPGLPSSPMSMAVTPMASSSASARLLELRLLHHYATVTCKTLCYHNVSAEKIWRDNVPRVAFAAASGSVATPSNHLTDAVLAVTALHLRSEFPHDRELIRASHAYMASSLSEYNRLLQKGINASNAEALFINSTLIAFQSTATRIFNKDEPGSPPSLGAGLRHRDRHTLAHLPIGTPVKGYGLPMSWFHAFQGVKAITAASWPWLRRSDVALPIINSQPALHLDIASAQDGFFGHLLDGLDEEIDLLTQASGTGTADGPDGRHSARPSSSSRRPASSTCAYGDYSCLTDDELFASSQGHGGIDMVQASHMGVQLEDVLRAAAAAAADEPDEGARSRHAYQHAVAVLNWAHGIRHTGACLAFPATVSRRFIDLLSSRTPRALTILACFFAMLKTLDNVWWLQGMARREVLGVVSLFNSDAVAADVERRWWPHMQWAVRVALYQDDAHPSNYIPPEVWGASWLDAAADDDLNLGLDVSVGSGLNSNSVSPAPAPAPAPESYVSHIDMIADAINGAVDVPEFEFDFASPAI